MNIRRFLWPESNYLDFDVSVGEAVSTADCSARIQQERPICVSGRTVLYFSLNF